MIPSSVLAYPPEALLELYTSMVRIRVVEECIAAAYPRQNMRCPVHLCVGQEAISAGVCFALQHEDTVFATHRSHGPYIAKGGDIGALLKELHGKAGGSTQGRGGSMHLMAPEVGFWGAVPIVASSIALATGVALAYHMRHESTVCVAFFGDGATEEGTFHESLQYAALKCLPIVYVCENNGFSVNTPLYERRAPHASVVDIAKAHAVAADRGDGNNVLDVYEKTQRAVARAREGDGPTFLEFTTYRWLEHCGHADDHVLGLRPVCEREAWKKRCPILQFEAALVQAGLFSQEKLRAIADSLHHSVQECLEQAEHAPWPDKSSAHTKVYHHA